MRRGGVAGVALAAAHADAEAEALQAAGFSEAAGLAVVWLCFVAVSRRLVRGLDGRALHVIPIKVNDEHRMKILG